MTKLGKLEDNLDVALSASIKFGKRPWRLIERNPVAHDAAGLGCSAYDHLAELPVPPLVIVPAHVDADILIEERRPGNQESALPDRHIDGSGIFGGPDTDDCHATRWVHDLGDRLGHPVRIFPGVIRLRASL